jgi:hypothetical protein
MPNTSTASEPPIDVLNDLCPTARVSSELPLALIEEIDQARGSVSRSEYLRMVISAAMTRSDPHLPGPPTGEDVIDTLARRGYRQHVRSVELARARARPQLTSSVAQR